MSNKGNIVITSAVRTAVGTLGKSLKNIPGYELGTTVLNEAIIKSKLKKDEIDEVIMGQVLTGSTGQNPARQSLSEIWYSKGKTSLSGESSLWIWLEIHCLCIPKYQIGRLKNYFSWWTREYVFSSSCYILREGKKLGDAEIVDTMIKDGLWDAFHGYHMGVTAENVAVKFQVTRDQQDKFALNSQHKALKAQKNQKFKDEIVSFKIKSKKAEIDFDKDEHQGKV